MTDEQLLDIAGEHAADGGRWPSDWLAAMRKAIAADRAAWTSPAAMAEAALISAAFQSDGSATPKDALDAARTLFGAEAVEGALRKYRQGI